MKILVTGSTGFIGSNVLKSFIGENNFKIETISFNNQINQRKIVSSEHHMFDLEHADLTDFLRAKKFDLLIHAAWSGLPNKSQELNAKNLHMSSVLFEKFANEGGKAIVGLGSCLEYGKRTGRIPETDLGDSLSDFGVKKRELCARLARLGIPYLWLRPFYLYGTNQHQNSILNLAIKNLSTDSADWIKDPFTGNDFVVINDFCKLLKILIQNKLWLEELNIGTSSPTQNIEFVNKIRRLLGKRDYDYFEKEFHCLSADLTKLRTALPHFSFLNTSEGLELIINRVVEARS